MGKNSNQGEVFTDYLTRYLRADTETRNAASKKAAILNEAEKAGLSKRVFKEAAKMEKMDTPERDAYLTTLYLYARYAGHDGQLELFQGVSTEQLEMAATDASGQESSEQEGADENQVDIEEAVADAEVAEMSDTDKQRLEDAAEFDGEGA